MPRVTLTANLRKHIDCPATDVDGETVHEALEAFFERYPVARGYVLDDQGALRKHIALFIDRDLITDRISMTDAVGRSTELYVMQALSGGCS